MTPKHDDVITRPLWVKEERLIWRLLNRFLDKIDKNQSRLSLRINAKNTPELYQYDESDTAYLWSLMTDLASSYDILQIKKEPFKAGVEIYHQAVITLNNDKIALLRLWLERPAQASYSTLWAEAVATVSFSESANISALAKSIVKQERTAEQIVAGFARIDAELAVAGKLTLRGLSARCFWGDSKFLDGREELLAELYPQWLAAIIPRPLFINVYLPASFSKVLFIENKDSF